MINNRKGLLIKGNWKKWIKRTKVAFFPMLLGILASSLLGSALIGQKQAKEQLELVKNFTATLLFN